MARTRRCLASHLRHLRAVLALALLAQVLAITGCMTTHCMLDLQDVRGRAFAAPIDRPRLLIAPLEAKDERWRDFSLYRAKIDPKLHDQIRELVAKGARSTSLFESVETVEWPIAEIERHRSGLQDGDKILIPEMSVCEMEAGWTPGAYAVSILTLGIWPLLSVVGIPTIPYHDEATWRLRYKLQDARSGEVEPFWDSEPILTNNASFAVSWSNAPRHVRNLLQSQGVRLFNGVAASFAPLAGGKQLDVDYPYEALSATVELRINVADDPSLSVLEVEVNEEQVTRRDRATDRRTQYPITVDLKRGANVVEIVAKNRAGEPVSKIEVSITRVK